MREIDKRLRDRKILVEGFNIDPIKGFVGVRIDVLRALRPKAEQKAIAEKGTVKLLEELLEGIPGYVVVTDAETRIEDFGYKGDDERAGYSFMVTLNVEHTYVVRDGKYLCEWGDPGNPIHDPEPLPNRKPQREVTLSAEQTIIAYSL